MCIHKVYSQIYYHTIAIKWVRKNWPGVYQSHLKGSRIPICVYIRRDADIVNSPPSREDQPILESDHSQQSSRLGDISRWGLGWLWEWGLRMRKLTHPPCLGCRLRVPVHHRVILRWADSKRVVIYVSSWWLPCTSKNHIGSGFSEPNVPRVE